MTPNTTADTPNTNTNAISKEGPDLNISRSPYDKKNYRQILLPNGLRVVLVSDTVAMTQAYNLGGIVPDEDNVDGGDGDGDVVVDVDDDDDDDDVDDNDDINADGDSSSSSSSASSEEEEEESGGLRNAAAAMIVGVGSKSDPPSCQGMAHFQEHLLFMGSKKYPAENAYDAYMSKHGGNDNAYTEYEHTVYHFEIPQEQLSGALDLFAQFFVAPLMKEASVGRELKAIESEFMLAKNSDSCRFQQLMMYTCGWRFEEHPGSKFGWGNYHSLKTLPEQNGHDPLEMLRVFYEEHHYAANMRLVVMGGYSLDYLQEEVTTYFSDIQSKAVLGSYTWDQMEHPAIRKEMIAPFASTSLQKVYYIAPVKDRHSLILTWQIPPQLDNWKAKPCDYLAHLIGHEGKGSLLASYQSKSWATGLCAGLGDEGYENGTGHALFTVSITLSQEGVTRWQEVVADLYKYVGMLRYHTQLNPPNQEAGLPHWIYEELRSIQKVTHWYADEEPPEDFVVELAEELSPWLHTPPDRLLDASGLLFEYDPETIKLLLDEYFVPGNARIDLASTAFGRSGDYERPDLFSSVDYYNHFDPGKECLPPSLEAFSPSKAGPPHIEPIFGTPFWCQSLDTPLLDRWTQCVKPQLPQPNSMLSLPQRNEFIPTDFTLKPYPPLDCDHPLLNCSIKLQIAVGKRKEWFPTAVTQYNSANNQILCVYEDEVEKWHQLDVPVSEWKQDQLTCSQFEGTLDNKQIKYRIVSLALEGERASLTFENTCDPNIQDGTTFPAIPPKASTSRLPKLITNTDELKLWHVQDRVFKRPTAELLLQLNCAHANQSVLHGACADILVNVVWDNLTEICYTAGICEIGSSLSTNDRGIAMRVSGFNDKLMHLFLIILNTLLKFRSAGSKEVLPDGFSKQRFALVLEKYRRSCTNSEMKADGVASAIRIRGICQRQFSARQKFDAIKSIDIFTFMTIVSSVLFRIGAEGLHTGNVDVVGAHLVKDAIIDLLRKTCVGPSGLPRELYPTQFVYKLPPTTYELTCTTKDPTECNAAVELYIQVGRDNVTDRVMVDLLMEIMNEPLYNQIRTKDQFGYHVSCDSRWTNGVIGIHISVVSASKTANEIQVRIDTFLLEFRQILVDMTQDAFMSHLVGLAKEKLNMFNSLSEETSSLWDEIRDGRYQFETDREEVICLKTMTKEQTLKAYDHWLSPENISRHQLIVKVMASEGPSSSGRPDIPMDDVGSFNDNCVDVFHAFCELQTFGKIY